MKHEFCAACGLEKAGWVTRNGYFLCDSCQHTAELLRLYIPGPGR